MNSIIEKLDRVAEEIEKESKVIAFAIDQISDIIDRTEKTAGLLESLKTVLKGVKDIGSTFISNLKPVSKEQAAANLVKLMRKYPDADERITSYMNNLVRTGLNPLTRNAVSLPAEMVAEGIASALSLKGTSPQDLKRLVGDNEALAKSIGHLMDSISAKTQDLIKMGR